MESTENMPASKQPDVSSVKVRAAQMGDVTEIVRLLWDDEQGRIREDITPGRTDAYLSAFTAIQNDLNSQVFVATLNDIVIGCLQLTVIPGLSYRGIRRALIEDLRVERTRRGCGIGRLLLAHAEAQATDKQCGLIELFVHGNRKDAHRFYERAGYAGAHKGFRKVVAPAGCEKQN